MEELSSQIELVKAVCDNLSLGVTIIDKDLRIVWVNKFLQNKGFKLEDVIDTNCFKTFENKDEILDKSSTLDSLKTGKTHKEVRKGTDGNDYEIISIPIKGNGEVKYVVEMSMDLTQIKAEQALKESEGSFKSMFESSADAIFIADLETKQIVDCNKKAEQLMSCSKKEILKMRADQLHPPDVVERTMEDFKKHAEGKLLLVESEVLTKDGKKIPVSINSAIIKVDGKPCLMGVFRDVTEQEKAEKKIQQTAQEWERTFNAISDLVFIQDKDFTITRVNKAFADAFKSKPEDIIGKKCYELLHKSNQPWPDCPFEKTKIDKKPHIQEIDDPNIGIPLLVTTSPIFDDKGELVGSVHIATDITERKKAEQELKKLTQELKQKIEERTKELGELYAFSQDIVKNSPIGVYTINKEGVIDSFNPAMVRLSGAQSADQVIGSNVFMMESYKKAGLTPYLKQGLEGKPFELDNIEYVSQTAGKYSVRHYNGVPIKNQKGEVVRLLLLVEDVTQKKHAEDEIIKLSEELEQKVEERTKELQSKMDELGRFNKLAVGRELRMIELKKRIQELEKELKSSKS